MTVGKKFWVTKTNMIKDEVKVLQIGQMQVAEEIKKFEPTLLLTYFETAYSLIQAHDDELADYIQNFDVILFMTLQDDEFYHKLLSLTAPYTVLCDRQLMRDPDVLTMMNNSFIQIVQTEDLKRLSYDLTKYFFSGQYGDKLKVANVKVLPSFQGNFVYNGNAALILEGSFGANLQPILSWQYNLMLSSDYNQELWLEYKTSSDLNLALKVSFIRQGTTEIVKVREFDNFNAKKPIIIENHDGKEYYLAVTLQVKGRGKLQIGNLHNRRSRGQYGNLVLGGQRLVDSDNQEIMTYFNPGNCKPPLNVYFSGYRTAEGFEGFGMMSSLGHPFLLIADPRLEGGSFYLGSEQLEQQIVATIKKTLRQLGFNHQQLIMSGLSMGTFGALYYSSYMNPKAVIVGKPLVNLGTMALNERIKRPGGFGTSLDLLLSMENGTNQAAAERLDHRFWDRFVKGNFDETLFAIAYMKNDDYDDSAYYDLLEHLSHGNVKIISKGIPGRHNDDSASINRWFLSQYDRIIQDNIE